MDYKFKLIVADDGYKVSDEDQKVTNEGLDNWKNSVPRQDVNANKNKFAAYILLVVEPPSSTDLGIAKTATICITNKWRVPAVGIVSYNDSVIFTAQTFTHEVGHILGIYHDYEDNTENMKGHEKIYEDECMHANNPCQDEKIDGEYPIMGKKNT